MARKPHKSSVRKGLKINPRSKLPNKALGKKILKDIDSIPNEQPRQPHQKAKAIKAVKNVKAGFGEAKRRKKTLARRPAVKALTKKKQGVSLLRKGDTEKHIQHLLRTAKQKDAKKEKRRKGRAKTVKAATKAARTAKQNLKKITALSGDKLKARPAARAKIKNDTAAMARKAKGEAIKSKKRGRRTETKALTKQKRKPRSSTASRALKTAGKIARIAGRVGRMTGPTGVALTVAESVPHAIKMVKKSKAAQKKISDKAKRQRAGKSKRQLAQKARIAANLKRAKARKKK